ncbi:MAG: ABC transporter substrate-binding protein [Candidatus Bipolaricaulia bacterium]
MSERKFRVVMFSILLLGFFSFGLYAQTITFWTTETEVDRMRVQQQMAAEFQGSTGIEVQVIPVDENLLSERLTAAQAARDLPDVIFHPVDFTIGWAEQGILDWRAAAEVVGELGTGTFAAGPLALAEFMGGYSAVPADGWGQLLVYRKDLVEANNLPTPDTWDNILTVAEALHNPPRMFGFAAATAPDQVYTQQVFEGFALSNGAALVDATGNVNLNTPEFRETLDFYKQLVEFTPPGSIFWRQTRLFYLGDRIAMMVWSPFILDELSGLRRDQPILVPDLAQKTGFVTVIQGPNGAAQYGQVSYFGITTGANTPAAKEWVKFLLTDGYLRWLSFAPEGKFPMRRGTLADPDAFIRGWAELEFGATTRAKISEFYGPEVVEAILSGIEGFNRWGFTAGKGALVSKIYGTKVVPELVVDFLRGKLTTTEAAAEIDAAVKALEE